MIAIKTDINWSEDINKAIDKKQFNAALVYANKKIGKALVKTCKSGIRRPPKTGRLYTIKGKTHRASSPGEYPANQTGALAKSIGSKVTGRKLYFGTNIGYAKFLQQTNDPDDTSENWVKIAPRPFLTLAHNEEIEEIPNIMENSIRTFLTK